MGTGDLHGGGDVSFFCERCERSERGVVFWNNWGLISELAHPATPFSPAMLLPIWRGWGGFYSHGVAALPLAWCPCVIGFEVTPAVVEPSKSRGSGVIFAVTVLLMTLVFNRISCHLVRYIVTHQLIYVPIAIVYGLKSICKRLEGLCPPKVSLLPKHINWIESNKSSIRSTKKNTTQENPARYMVCQARPMGLLGRASSFNIKFIGWSVSF